ncbi:MAG: GIY-YIG nuclease family protein [Crocinitomicaceae bacterium]|nr:GIY-YIG nuclease family protein [Crocinitomicaceae bacterium]
MKYFVYILYSPSINKYYVGQTTNIENRLKFHNSKEYNKIWTKRGIPWTLVYKEEYESRSESMQREKFIKKQKSRIYIEKLIAISSLA